MLERLSSLKFTLASLAGMMLLLGTGMVLGNMKTFSLQFAAMNRTLLLDWLRGPAWEQPAVAIWFLALCMGVGVMLLNLGACTFTRLLPRLRGASKVKGWTLTLVHLVMLVVLLGHGAEMGLGHKQEEIRLLPGQSHQLPDGGQLTVARVVFWDDPAILNLPYVKARWQLVAGKFSATENLVELVFVDPAGITQKAEVRILQPHVRKGARYTLMEFYRQGEGEEAKVGAMLAVTSNPLTTLFFVAYALWVVLYTVLAWVTWRAPVNKEITSDATIAG
ncbi:MAG: hypothetical protein V1797_10885 [Pseudomonadota bacterium]